MQMATTIQKALFYLYNKLWDQMQGLPPTDHCRWLIIGGMRRLYGF